MLSAPMAAQSRESFALSIVQSTRSAPSPTTTTLLGPSSTAQPASAMSTTKPAEKMADFMRVLVIPRDSGGARHERGEPCGRALGNEQAEPYARGRRNEQAEPYARGRNGREAR